MLGWFGVNIDLFSDTVVKLLERGFDVSIPEWPIEVIAGICMLTTTIYGFKFINILATIMIPVLIFITGKMFFGSIESMSIAQYWSVSKI